MKKIKYSIFMTLITFLGMNRIDARQICAVCGEDALPIPIGVPNFVSKLITLVQVATPIIIIIVAIIKYTKVVASNDEKVAKEANSSFMRSLITGVSIFLVVTIVKFSFSLLGAEYSDSLNCISCFLNGEDHCSTQTCPTRDDNNPSGIKTKVCTDYQTKDTCPTKDIKNNLCEWNEGLQLCEIAGKAKHCSEYTTDECPSIDHYGHDCEIISIGKRSQCKER